MTDDSARIAEDLAEEMPDLCFVLIEDNGSFCGWPLPCPEHSDGTATADTVN